MAEPAAPRRRRDASGSLGEVAVVFLCIGLATGFRSYELQALACALALIMSFMFPMAPLGPGASRIVAGCAGPLVAADHWSTWLRDHSDVADLLRDYRLVATVSDIEIRAKAH